ncbi:response regulator [Chryseosolibacter indicus]|uniref:histidine kinase n=1 Tax=Chryseosolibacter indicus TaxID=2782351 RepID=A0ABS5VTP3_9BACT|nr:response regulator [Chryseosolibacter indicus]MBT1704777.1 response regulator [Chryseosolibacter indicus]
MKSNFKRNLLFGFGASLLILIITSAASFISINNLLRSSGLVNHTHEVIIGLDAVNAALIDAQSSQRGFLLTSDERFLDPYYEANNNIELLLRNIRSLTADNQAQQAKIAQLEDLLEQRISYLEHGIAEKKKGKDVDVEVLQRGRAIMLAVRKLIAEMEEGERALLTERTSTMNKFAAFTPVIIIVAAMVALLITVLFYIRVRSDFEQRMQLQQELLDKDADISKRIEIIRGIADKIAQGNYETRVDDKESDALGSVAGALNKMAESLNYSFNLLSDKEWLQTGLTQLNDVMIGEKDVDALSSEITAFLSQYTESNVGAFYILQENELHHVGGYAFVPDKSRKKLRINEGITGQTISTKAPIHLKDIPSENISISFASGELRPKDIIALPILDGYTVKGAIELGSIKSFTERDIEFLKASTPNIGIAISTAQNRRRLQELLEETQAQAEELKTQHSELENLNSELEVQAEKLQASEEELKVQQEELKQANQELEERSRLLEERNQLISERNIEIQHKADQLAQSTRYKSEFLANMSHELRTPLNSILLLSRLMSENPEKNLTSEQVEYANVIQNSGNGLLSLIDEILDLSKIEAGKMQLEYQMVSVREITNDMNALFSPVANEKKIEFKLLVQQEVPSHIEIDKLRLEQILRNLLSNAIKFTSNGYVSLDVLLEEDESEIVKFVVKDTGIGIPKEKHVQIFEAFQQADGSTRRKYGGTGLGLSISRELSKLLGGDISLVSEVGQGSEFTVRIPISKKTVVKSKLNQQEKEVIAEVIPEPQPVKKVDPRYISTEIPSNVPDDRKIIKRGDKVILIIEDDVNFAKALLDYTRKREYKGVVAVRGDEGVELAKQLKPLGILLDIQLPVKSGWEVMEELKGNAQTRHIPVHIMSSLNAKSESLMKGAVNFINKPVAFEQMHEVFKKIEYVLSHHPKKVLIVEENAKHAKALAYFLETFDVNLDIANAVDGAVDSLKNRNVDCVILDMGIPDQKSYDTLEEIKKTSGLENLPIIIFTGKSLSQKEELKIKQYADSIVVKTAHSYKRILDEVSLFLHLMEKDGEENKGSKFHKLGALDEVLKNKTVLVADDDMRNVFSLTKALEKYQMNVIAAVDGRDALQKLKENPQVDIVLMDMMMPEMDGYETTAAIRKDLRYRNLPVIAVTAKAMMGDRAKCINAGASDYITKPVDIDQLFSLLRVWLYEKI